LRYREQILLQIYNETKWEELRNEVQIYEINLPKNLGKIPKGRESKWIAPALKTGGYRSKDKGNILEVTEIWTNPKNTVKIVAAGNNAQIISFSRDSQVEGFSSLNIDRYKDEPSDVFDQIKKGTWIVCVPRYSSSSYEIVAFISNEKKIETVERILNILDEMQQTSVQYNRFKWKKENVVPTYGTLGLKEVLAQQVIFLRSLRQHKWRKRKKTWDLWNAVKANLSFKKTSTDIKVKLKALDGKSYFFECSDLTDISEENYTTRGYREFSFLKLDYWLPFVYREGTDNFLTYNKIEQTHQLVRDSLLPLISKLVGKDFTFGVNQRKVKVTRRTTKSKAVLNFLNGNLVKSENLKLVLYDYFVKGIPIVPTPPQISPNNSQPKKRVMSRQAKRLVDEGLNGILRDLEGELPFHLNIIYKEKKRKWYIEIAGKKFHVKGGYNSLNKVKSAISGRGRTNYRSEGSDSRGTRVIRARLGELVGDKAALWIILKVKKMGALVKAMGA